ncbi:MAG: acyl carrier protein [Thermoanaerobaculia bacterium]
MTTDEAIEQIKRALEAVAPSRAADFRGVRSLDDLDGLGIDSITTLELVDRLERRLGVSFSDDFLLDLKSARDLVAAIQEQVNQGGSPP